MSSELTEALLDVQSELTDTRQKQKELFVDGVNTRHHQMEQRKEEEAHLNSIDLSVNNTEYYKRVANNSKEHFLAVRESGVFLDDSFGKAVPYFGKNVILCMATTGDGKSTISANLTYQSIKQGQRVLVITNEENVQDVYNRVTCLLRGWAYNDHRGFTDDQIEHFSEMIIKLSKRITVVDDSYGDGTGVTTTLEGMQAVLESTLKPGNEFDTIIIDYYQNIDRSNKMPSLEPWQVQERFGKWLEQFRKRSKAPITLLAQRKGRKKDDETDIKNMIEGRKSILNTATCVMEIEAQRDMLRTAFTIKKTRFPDALNKTIHMGFEKGRYVPYTDEFKKEVNNRREIEARRELEGYALRNVNPGGNDAKSE
jgi:hypothetical protein